MTNEPRLVRTLNLFDIIMIGIAATIGGSSFVLLGIAIGLAGPGVIIAFILNAIIATLTAMAYAELGSSIPEVGGGYRWIREGLPRPLPFVNGWLGWFGHMVATALYATSFGIFINGLLKIINIDLIYIDKIFAIIAIISFAFINFKGTNPTGKIGNIITLLQLIISAIFIIVGAFVIYNKPDWIIQFSDFTPNGMLGILSAMTLTFIAFEGYEVITQSGEECKNPRRNIPLAIFITIASVTLIYVLMAIIAIGATNSNIPSWQFIGLYGELGISNSAQTFIPFGALIILIGGVISMLAALNASIYSSSRVALAMSRYYNMPKIVSKIHRSYKTPYIAIFISSTITLLIASIFPLQEIAKAASLIFLIIYAQVNLTAINIRYTHGDDLKYGFKIPLFPLIPFIGFFLNIGLIIYMIITQPIGLLITIIWIISGLIIYRVYLFRKEVEHTAPLLTSISYGVKKNFRILVPYIAGEQNKIIDLIIDIANRKQAEIDIIRVIGMPSQMSLSGGLEFRDYIVKTFEPLRRLLEERGITYNYLPRVAHDITNAILTTIEEQKINLLGYELENFKNNKRLRTLLTCDALAIKSNNPSGINKIVAFYDDESPHSKLVLDLLKWFNDKERIVIYLSTLSGIDYVKEKDKLYSIGCNVIETKLPDKINYEWFRNVLEDNINTIKPDLLILPAYILKINVLESNIIDSINNTNIIIASHFTIHMLHKIRVLLRKIK
jgi:amino acid transporter